MNVLIYIGNTLTVVKIIRETYNLCITIQDKIKKLKIIDNREKFKNDENELINYIKLVK
jgi:hypothetical protein